MASRFIPPRFAAYDSSGDPLGGAKLNFYVTATTTRLDTYSDEGRQTANTNPVVADSAGRFGAIYLSPRDYRVILTDSSDTEIWDHDPVRGDARHNLNDTAAPGVTDDIDQGYDEGSIWVDRTNDLAYICVDSTNGAAVWLGLASTDLNGSVLTLDADADSDMDPSNDDRLIWTLGGTSRLEFKTSGILMQTGGISLGAGSELTLDASGTITPTGSRHTVDTNADASADNLDTVVATNTDNGALLFLYAENSARVVTVRDAQGGNGQVHLKHSATVDLDTEFPLVLQRRTSDWYEVARPTLPPVEILETGTVSAAATLDLTTGTWSRFKTIRLRFQDFLPASDDNELLIRTSSDGGSTFESGASDYSYVLQRTDASAANDVIRSATASAIRVADDVGSATGESISGTIVLHNPSGTRWRLIEAWTVELNASQVLQMHHATGLRRNSADVDGLQLLFTSGNITSGTYVLEGLR